MRIKKYAVLFSMLLVGLCGVNAQTTTVPNADNSLRRSEVLFENGNYQAAEVELCNVLKRTDDIKNQEKIRYMIISSRYRMNKLETSDVERFFEDYPYTGYKNRLYFIAGDNSFRYSEYDKAFEYLDKCDLFMLPDNDCQQGMYALAVSSRETGKTEIAKLNFSVLKEVGGKYKDDAAYNLAHIYYSEGNLKKAYNEFSELTDNEKYAQDAQRYIADILYKEGKYEKALSAVNNILETYGNECNEINELYRIKGQSLYRLNDYYNAISFLESYCTSVNASQREAVYMLGMSYFNTRGYTKAVEYLSKVTDVDDALSQNAYLHIGISNVGMGDTEKARMAFAHASSSSFNRDVTLQALYNYALCIHETSYSPFNESVTVFERLLNEYPQSRYTAMVSKYLADAYLATTSYKSSLESMDKIKNPTPKILEAKQIILMRYGAEQFANGSYSDAVSTFSRSIALGQYNRKAKADALYWRGESYYRLNDFDNAANDFVMYTEIENDRNTETYAMAFYNLGYINFKKKQYGKALAYFRRSENVSSSMKANVKADMANRMGDCYYRSRNFDEAEKYYDLAAKTDPAQGDYAMFQRSFILGLQKNYDAKIRQIDQMISKYPESVYCDDATFEKGRAYVLSENNTAAIATYTELINRYPSSQYVRRAEFEIGLLYYQNRNYSKAEEAYKNVISKYPGTPEAGQAQNDLRNLYIDQNKVDEYFKFLGTTGNGGSVEVSEKDSLTYLAAERIYMNGDKPRGAYAMEAYLQDYPDGMFSINANYYIGLYKYNEKNHQEAIPYLEKVNSAEASQFAEESLVMLSEIYYETGDLEKAMSAYRSLRDMASMEDRKILAETGIMRCAEKLNDSKTVVEAANALLQHSKVDPQLAIEAHYLSAIAYMDMGDKDSAMKEWKTISGDTRNVYGAEAKYRVAELYFNAGNDSEAEKEIMDYIEKGTPHAYWMARSFILQSDIYMKQGKNIDARQFLLSLKQNYNEKDDIASMIDVRLEKLKNNQ